MSIFGNVTSAIFKSDDVREATLPVEAPSIAPTTTAAAQAEVDIAAVLAKHGFYSRSAFLSVAARKQLAQELHYSGDMNDLASMNKWLHEQVMQKLTEKGGKVPSELRKAA